MALRAATPLDADIWPAPRHRHLAPRGHVAPRAADPSTRTPDLLAPALLHADIWPSRRRRWAHTILLPEQRRLARPATTFVAAALLLVPRQTNPIIQLCQTTPPCPLRILLGWLGWRHAIGGGTTTTQASPSAPPMGLRLRLSARGRRSSPARVLAHRSDRVFTSCCRVWEAIWVSRQDARLLATCATASSRGVAVG